MVPDYHMHHLTPINMADILLGLVPWSTTIITFETMNRDVATSCDLFGMLQSRTPCFGRLYDALPEESRTARVKLVVPQGASADTDLVVHLAGTGDHGFERRLHLGFPLIKQVCPHPKFQDHSHVPAGSGWRRGSRHAPRCAGGRRGACCAAPTMPNPVSGIGTET